MPVISSEVIHNEDIDAEIVNPAMEAFERGIHKLGFKVTDEISDRMFDLLDDLLNEMFPNSDYRNYN